ncbi:hypothetical protein NUW58_g3959 [Xylaria curta]|uniref:Uncharacterized protein n=1 Tax=Xylaria curta TaxID=42375 RepID=A0ACC1P903_9PEZI|nr:hypothetical protein NUW58_g3959 [Xylaria curta]
MAIDNTALDLVVSLVLPSIQAHRKQIDDEKGFRRPFVLGLSGLQGSGKSTWAVSLARALSDHHHFKTIILSLDDLYLPHEELVRLRESNPNNRFYRNRGQPGTHDETLARQFFDDLHSGKDVALPSFDKSSFNGEGDRVPENEWQKVSQDPPLDVIIFEGWCVGFLSLSDADLQAKWSVARDSIISSNTDGGKEHLAFQLEVLGTHSFEDVKLLNDNLKRYNETFMGPCHFDYLIHLDTDRLANVYRWRIQQEKALRATKGMGQTNEQVIAFVQVYMPAYELYLEKLRKEASLPRRGADGLRTQTRIQLDDNPCTSTRSTFALASTSVYHSRNPRKRAMDSPMNEDYADTWSHPADAGGARESSGRAPKRRRTNTNGGPTGERGIMRDGNRTGLPRFIGSGSRINLVMTVYNVLARSHTGQGRNHHDAAGVVPGEEDQLTGPSP